MIKYCDRISYIRRRIKVTLVNYIDRNFGFKSLILKRFNFIQKETIEESKPIFFSIFQSRSLI